MESKRAAKLQKLFKRIMLYGPKYVNASFDPDVKRLYSENKEMFERYWSQF